jgi:glycosyltransferase involved in cell wall biosynthesis
MTPPKRPLRVWHVPVNYGSLPSNTVRVLRAGGVDAHGLFFANSVMRTHEGMRAVVGAPIRQPARWLLSRVRWIAAFLRELLTLRPDVIHWYFGRTALPLGVDLLLVRLLKIPRVVEWQGSDIRAPEVEYADNPYYAPALQAGYEYAQIESQANAVARQRRFADAGFASAAPLGMLQYVHKDIFPHTSVIRQRVLLSDFEPRYPANAVPRIVHSSTARIAKGTPAVLRAIEQLRSEQHPFDFKLVSGLPYAQAQQIVRDADIFLDQFVLGDFGMASLEALALGKPVVCYLKPALAALYPPDLPIINATQETLPDALRELIASPALRRELGERGRAYMERHYNVAALTAELTALYRAVMERQR